MSDEHNPLQLGMLNPPRRVKRLRELALKDTTRSSSSSSSSPPNPPLSTLRSPSPRAATPPAASNAPQARRRGRKPAGPLSKSAREQLRKTNHSVIEKRRREKINEALAALRELVPNDKPEGEKREDKEFKLEVLVRTVEYLRIMVDKVKNLEAALCQKCGGNLMLGSQASSKEAEEGEGEDTQIQRPVKRMRVQEPESKSDDENENDIVRPQVLPQAPAVPPPRLPSISSWMSDPALINPHAYQLPSPPQTVPFAPTTIASTGFPPRLVLPAPIGPTSPASFTSLASSPTAPLPSLTSLVSPAALLSLTPRAPIPSLKSLASPLPAFASKSPAFLSLTSRDRDVPDFPLDSDADANTDIDIAHTTSYLHLLRSPSSSGNSRRGRYNKNGGSNRHGGNSAHNNNDSIRPSSGSTTRSDSPDSPWSRDDQTAASLLLNISSRRSRKGEDGESSRESEWQKRGKRERGITRESERQSGSGSERDIRRGRMCHGLGEQSQRRTFNLKCMMDASDTTNNTTNNTNHATAHSVTNAKITTRTQTRLRGLRTRRTNDGVMLEAQTPSSLLGMGEDSGDGGDC